VRTRGAHAASERVKRNVQIKPICARISSQARQRYSRGFVEIVGINFPPLFTVAGFAPRTASSPLVRPLPSPLRLLVAHYVPMQRENVRAPMHRRSSNLYHLLCEEPPDFSNQISRRSIFARCRTANISQRLVGETCTSKKKANK